MFHKKLTNESSQDIYLQILMQINPHFHLLCCHYDMLWFIILIAKHELMAKVFQGLTGW